MSVDVINLAVQALRDYLLAKLPAEVTALNALRAPVLKTPIAGPFSVTAGMEYRLSTVRDDPSGGTLFTIPVSTSLTAAQIATVINTAAPPGLTASADTLGRLVITGTAPVSGGDPAVVTFLADTNATGSNAALGFDPGGEFVLSSPLVSPTARGVSDGRPSSVPDMGQGFWVIIGDRKAVPVSGSSLRRDLWDVTLSVDLYKPDMLNNVNRDRSGITGVVRAVSEVLLSTDGRYLGRQAFGDVQGLEVSDLNVYGTPFRWVDAPDLLHDVATMTVRLRIFQLPANS